MSEHDSPQASVTLEPVERLLTIGVFARRSRLSPKALRLYERLGVLVPAYVDGSSGYRRYAESQLGTARLVALLRRLDMPLARVAEVVSAADDDRAGLVAVYWEELERRTAAQRELVAHLLIQLSGEERSYDMYEIEERDVPEQIVLTEQRHVRVPELGAWLPEAIGRLVQAADEQGGVAAPVFVVYHGEVNEDSDGPVEVCVPVRAAGPGLATRTELAHREATRDHEGAGRVPADPLGVRGRRRLDPVGGSGDVRLAARGLLRRLGRRRPHGRGLRHRVSGGASVKR